MMHRSLELNYAPCIRVLKELREIDLAQVRFPRARRLHLAAQLALFESPEFVDELCSGNVWGSAGSMFDLLFLGNVEGPEEELLADEQAYSRVCLQLAEAMEAQGIRY
jgi:hypothetical protein